MPLTPENAQMTGDFDPSTIPLARPPPGAVPNFAHPESRCWQPYLTVALCLTLAVSFTSMQYQRAYARHVWELTLASLTNHQELVSSIKGYLKKSKHTETF
ncbi:MAG: hypothetical protein Q9219_006792 [cf. Caloplaca sp. 3 TL-2023]